MEKIINQISVLFGRCFCKHKNKEFIRNIYGEEMYKRNWKRSEWRCEDCGKLVYGDSVFWTSKVTENKSAINKINLAIKTGNMNHGKTIPTLHIKRRHVSNRYMLPGKVSSKMY